MSWLPKASKEWRRAPRRHTHWIAECRVGEAFVVGTILDITAHGAFFAPEGAAIGQPAVGADPLAIDGRVAISFDREPNLAGLELPARVRWIGYSQSHGRHGFGLEFTTAAAPK